MLDNFDTIQINQIGCGGIGSWIISPIYKLLSEFTNAINQIRSNDEKNFRLTLSSYYNIIDEDIIEESNIKRQNFSKNSLFKYKAEELGRVHRQNKLSENVTMMYNIDKINSQIKIENMIYPYGRNLSIIIGCVDNVKTRYKIENYLKNTDGRVIYIDGGNEVHHGQVLTNLFNFSENIFKDQENSKNIDFADVFPKKDPKTENNEGCAVFGAQTLGINHMVGSQIIMKLQSILIDKLIGPNYIYFSTSGIAMEMKK